MIHFLLIAEYIVERRHGDRDDGNGIAQNLGKFQLAFRVSHSRQGLV